MLRACLRGSLLFLTGLASEARRLSEELVRLSEEQSAPVWLGAGRLLRAWSLAAEGEVGDALVAESRGALALAGSTRHLAAAPLMMWCHADTLRLTGHVTEALQFTESTLALSAGIRQPFCDAGLHRLRGDLLLAVGGYAEEEVEAEYLRALEIARSQNAKSFELRAATSLARLWREQGKRAAARELLAPVYAWLTDRPAPRGRGRPPRRRALHAEAGRARVRAMAAGAVHVGRRMGQPEKDEQGG